jgi:hypothetical protein
MDYPEGAGLPGAWVSSAASATVTLLHMPASQEDSRTTHATADALGILLQLLNVCPAHGQG